MLSTTQRIAVLAAVLLGAAGAAADICGVRGNDRGNDTNYLYDSSGKYNTYAGCAALCVGDAKCQSFGYSAAECMLFNVPLAGNFDAVRRSPDTYYDRGCLSATTTTSRTATKTTLTTVVASVGTLSGASLARVMSTPASAGQPDTANVGTSPASTATAASSTGSAFSFAGSGVTSTGSVLSSPGSAFSSAPSAPPPSSTGASPATSTSTTITTTTTKLTNPYATLGCPLPTTITISNLTSRTDSVDNNVGAVRVTYGNGTFACPGPSGRCQTYNGLFDCACDPDGLLRVVSDGRSWLWVQQWYWCDAQPQRAGAKGADSLAATANFTALAAHVAFDARTGAYAQAAAAAPLTVPVDAYGTGGIIGFSPVDVNGVAVPSCPMRVNHNPVLSDPATCT